MLDIQSTYKTMLRIFIPLMFFVVALSRVQVAVSESILVDQDVSFAIRTEKLAPVPDAVKSVVPIPDLVAKTWMLVDFNSGWVLGSKHADVKIEPASLTKLMTSLLVFEALTKGEITLNDKVQVSNNAWQTGGSRMFIQVKSQVDVESLLKGLIIQSGNDAAVALAEFVGGSEPGFVVKMNRKAVELGMHNSHFINSHGLPDEAHYSTTADMVILGRALIRNFPDLFSLYSTKEYTYNNITQSNRNLLLSRDLGVDGLKTGYTKAARYCFIGTAKRDNMRLIAIVTGAESDAARADSVQSLLQYGYAAYDGLLLYRPAAEVASLPLWMGQQSKVSVSVNSYLGLVYPKGQKHRLSAALEIPHNLEAPLQAGTEVGAIMVQYDGKPLLNRSLLINRDYPEGAWWLQLFDSVKRLF